MIKRVAIMIVAAALAACSTTHLQSEPTSATFTAERYEHCSRFVWLAADQKSPGKHNRYFEEELMRECLGLPQPSNL